MIFQPLQEVATHPVAQTVLGLVNIGGIALVYAQGWRHRDKTKDELQDLNIKVERLDGKVEQTVCDSTCLHRMNKIENVVRSEMRELRDEMTGLGISRNGKLCNIDARLRDVEQQQARQEGTHGPARDEDTTGG